MIPVSLHKLGALRGVNKGEVLYSQGTAAEEGYFLLEGSVGLFVGSTHPTQVDQLERDDYVGFGVFTDAGQHLHTAVALTEGRVLAFSKGIMATLPSLDSSFFPALMRSVSHSLNRTMRETTAGVPSWKPRGGEGLTSGVRLTCPLCGAEFDDTLLDEAKLTPQRVERDLRVRYEEADPLWYGVTVCPSCHYASPSEDFGNLSDADAEILRRSGFTIPGDGFSGFSAHRSLREVLSAYQLALRCSSLIGCSPAQELRMYLSLHWLYDDILDTERSHNAAYAALDTYARLAGAYFDLLPEADRVRCDIQRAELCRFLGHIDDARRLHLDCISRDVSPLLTQLSRDALASL
jgi:hypothetical protein